MEPSSKELVRIVHADLWNAYTPRCVLLGLSVLTSDIGLENIRASFKQKQNTKQKISFCVFSCVGKITCAFRLSDIFTYFI